MKSVNEITLPVGIWLDVLAHPESGFLDELRLGASTGSKSVKKEKPLLVACRLILSALSLWVWLIFFRVIATFLRISSIPSDSAPRRKTGETFSLVEQFGNPADARKFFEFGMLLPGSD
jgi:hypothetical protein